MVIYLLECYIRPLTFPSPVGKFSCDKRYPAAEPLGKHRNGKTACHRW